MTVIVMMKNNLLLNIAFLVFSVCVLSGCESDLEKIPKEIDEVKVDLLKSDAQAALSRQMEASAHAGRLSHFGGTLLNELHGHHQIEDRHYFPRLIKLDARLERGFDLLEKDHEAMDGLLHGMAEGANSVLRGAEVGPFLDRLSGFERSLNRHLTDEEDIVVPVVLHTGFAG